MNDNDSVLDTSYGRAEILLVMIKQPLIIMSGVRTFTGVHPMLMVITKVPQLRLSSEAFSLTLFRSTDIAQSDVFGGRIDLIRGGDLDR